GTAPPRNRAEWEIAAVPGVMPQMRISDVSKGRVTVRSRTYTIEAPEVLESAGRNFLSQLEDLALSMESVSGRKRRVKSTEMRIEAGKAGASAAHGGRYIRFGPGFWYFDRLQFRHSLIHELGHNYNFYHGGLHETMVELVRAGKAPQIGQQDVKWLFFDRMNGTRQNEKVGYEKSYPDIGLYLYCYSQNGTAFTRYLVAHENDHRKKLRDLGYSEAEITAALCSVAMGRDMEAICRAYGLDFSRERINSVIAQLPKQQ
ncbi:MAG: hypothetical protein ACK4UN_11545, partial [Limisphaerales bacterium]